MAPFPWRERFWFIEAPVWPLMFDLGRHAFLSITMTESRVPPVCAGSVHSPSKHQPLKKFYIFLPSSFDDAFILSQSPGAWLCHFFSSPLCPPVFMKWLNNRYVLNMDWINRFGKVDKTINLPSLNSKPCLPCHPHYLCYFYLLNLYLMGSLDRDSVFNNFFLYS